MGKAQRVVAELARLLGTQPYFAGPNLSLADLLVASQLAFLVQTPEWAELRAGKDHLAAWLERMLARPSLQATT
ncbi:MAG: glutathione S-transferase domain-containing protein, partial [Acetobacteraceae bacterium]|nr:glutathione S-transferase domain-containing protein [Acetobacteraceae bacterium]